MPKQKIEQLDEIELAAVVAALRKLIDDDKFPHSPRLKPQICAREDGAPATSQAPTSTGRARRRAPLRQGRLGPNATAETRWRSRSMAAELRPGFTPEELRDIQREVALTYRRVGRAGKAEGLSPPRYEERATKAALAKYLELAPGAAANMLEASARKNTMIANAIRVNTDWFWFGPDV